MIVEHNGSYCIVDDDWLAEHDRQLIKETTQRLRGEKGNQNGDTGKEGCLEKVQLP